MNSLIVPEDTIKNKIFTLRGVQVMLDSDLAGLYNVKPTRLREQVKRNIKRFPSDFMFRLIDSEVEFMVSQNAIPSKMYLGGHLPYVFTEQGVANLSSILNSEKAIEVNIQIMRAFIDMRKFISKNTAIFYRLDSVERKQIEYDKNFEKIFDALQSKVPEKGIFFEGSVFDAYSFVSSLIRKASKEIILVDNYVDESTLQLLNKRSKNVSVKIYTKISDELFLDLKKYNSQYPQIEIKDFELSHDRFLIIDKEIYHFGASLKDLGKKWFGFSKFEKDSFKLIERLI